MNNFIKPVNSNKNLLIAFIANTRNYSTTSNLNNFYEWFCGLADGESSFYIKKGKSINQFEFIFQIGLHMDDSEMLYFIEKTLGIGKVSTSGKFVYFRVNTHKELLILFDIFEKFPLNSTKFLNYLDFKKAFELYSTSKSSAQTIEIIDNLKSNMNSQRINFTLPDSHKIRMNPYWLLGFIEGEGSFSVKKGKNFPLTFSLSQKDNTILMKAIKDFFDNLGVSKKWRNFQDVVSVSSDKRIGNTGDINLLFINRVDYITNVLIPFFDSLIWHSKKEKDYKDWKTILELKNLGIHYTDEGVRVINLILSQMNLKRSSTNETKLSQAQLEQLREDVEKLLSGPSNLEIKEDGRIFIKSLNKYYTGSGNIKVELQDLNGLVLYTFDSISECAKFVGLAPRTVTTRLQKNQQINVDNKELFVKKVENHDS